MSKKLIKQVRLHYPKHTLNGKRIDILIENGRILQVGNSLKIEDNELEIIDVEGLICLPGLMDAQCTIPEPGNEHRESLFTASKAAHKGGFHCIAMLPTTYPVIDNKAQLRFALNQAEPLSVRIVCYGSITKAAEGKELSEMFDLKEFGAIAFSDGKHAVKDVNMMKRALDYVKNFDGLVCSFPHDERMNPGGMVNESPNNTALGIKSMPELAEEIMLHRDVYLLEYTDSAMHVSTVSTKGSLNIIKSAKAKKLNISAAVALPNLLYTEKELNSFNSTYKTLPHLRDEPTQNTLIEAVNSGLIDMIVTDHTPENIENKDREFDHAAYGMTMLETALSLINSKLIDRISWDTIASTMSINPRIRFGIDLPKLEKGENFEFTLFDPSHTWTYNKESCVSKASNSPVYNEELVGKVLNV